MSYEHNLRSMFNIGIVPGSDQARNRTAEIGLHYFGYLFLFCAVPAMAALPDEGDLTAEAFGLAVFEEADRRASASWPRSSPPASLQSGAGAAPSSRWLSLLLPMEYFFTRCWAGWETREKPGAA